MPQIHPQKTIFMDNNSCDSNSQVVMHELARSERHQVPSSELGEGELELGTGASLPVGPPLAALTCMARRARRWLTAHKTLPPVSLLPRVANFTEPARILIVSDSCAFKAKVCRYVDASCS